MRNTSESLDYPTPMMRATKSMPPMLNPELSGLAAERLRHAAQVMLLFTCEERRIKLERSIAITLSDSGEIIVRHHSQRAAIVRLIEETPALRHLIQEALQKQQGWLSEQLFTMYDMQYRVAYAEGGKRAAYGVYDRFMRINSPECTLHFDGITARIRFNGQMLEDFLGNLQPLNQESASA